MQNRYVGDVGDFGKYGLLRALVRADDLGPALQLGLVWYLVADEERNANGQHIAYLTHGGHRFRDCDPELFDCLHDLVVSGRRTVHDVHVANVLGSNSASFAELLRSSGPAATKSAQHRTEWINRALEATNGSDVVFFDPDNGIETARPRQGVRSAKHVYLDELLPFADRGQSLVIYHHLGRSGSHLEQVEARRIQLAEALGCELPIALRFQRGTSRAFFVVPNSRDRLLIASRTERFMSSPWAQHFTAH